METDYEKANRLIEGTGCVIIGRGKGRHIRVTNEVGLFLFHTKTLEAAVRRSLERASEDFKAHENWIKAGKPGKSYKNFIKPAKRTRRRN